MLTRLRTHFGTAGLIVAIVALIAALGGAAIAASGGGDGKATASAKGKPGPRGKTGKTGPAGPAGPAGPQGPAGANGKDGANGTAGANGAVGPTGPTGKTGNAGAVGAVGEVGPTGPTGEVGTTGPTGAYGGIFLPEGVTETGYWSFTAPGTKTIEDGSGNPVTVGTSEVWVPISFLDHVEIPGAYVPRFQGEPEFEETCGEGTGGAGGNNGNPKAPNATLCVYEWGGGTNATFSAIKGFPNNVPGTIGSTGALLQFETTAEGPARGAGTWALTG